MRAGKLDRIITIQRGTKAKVGPHAVPTWTDIATVRAEIVQQSASEFLTGFGEAETGTVIFRLRYLDGITTVDQIAYDGRLYNIKEIAEIGRRRGIELRAVAVS